MYSLALEIATEAHKGQIDKAGKDYIQHPIFVASLVESEQEKVVALLHDVIEDTPITENDLISKGIPEILVEAVLLLTKKRGISYSEYLKNLKDNGLARNVKIADLTHNSDLSRLAEITENDIRRSKKYKEAIEYLNN